LRVTVKFEQDGSVSEATIREGDEDQFSQSGSFRRTPRVICIERVFRAARVRTFHDAPAVRANKAVAIE
jgi:hypothetical protein